MELEEGLRVRRVNERPVQDGSFVLYWMIAARRATSNYALDRAIAWAEAVDRPLVVLEALRCDYRWSSDRIHRFVIDGMRDNAAAFSSVPVLYYPYVEPSRGAGRGLLTAVAAQACVVVTDEFPCFFLPKMVAAAGKVLPCRLEAVDSNGILPLRLADRTYSAAAHFRRHVQRALRQQLTTFPREEPFADRLLKPPPSLAASIQERWPPVNRLLLDSGSEALERLPIDHLVAVAPMTGGSVAAGRALQRFVRDRIDRYHEARSHPDEDATSRLSPYLHFGHIAPQQIFTAVMRAKKWSASKLPSSATGAREGWWNVSAGAEAYLDQLIVWRELAYNACATRPDDYDQFESLPAWARQTLARHASDKRPYVYSLAQFENAETHDPLWNAAQRQLRHEGWFHGYLRMLWGKKILEWSATPQEALHVMRSLMDRWSLDGRNPNSYAGYFWTLGRYDRPWPERPIFGTVRSMSSDNTRKKVSVKAYLLKYGPASAGEAPVQGSLLPI